MDGRTLIANDRFAAETGVRLVSCGGGSAVLELELTEKHLNAEGRPQGGLLFTLADTAFAVAANEDARNAGRDTVSLSSTINFLRPAAGSTLTATAVTVSRGRTTCCVDVTITDAAGNTVAKAQCTGYTRN